MNLYDIAIARKLSGGGGGGNPNTVQTVTGTLNNAFTNVNVAELSQAISSNNATAIFDLDMTALGAGTAKARVGTTLSDGLDASACFVISSSSFKGFEFTYTSTGTLTAAKSVSEGGIVDMSDYASYIITTLTIIWHPLPN